jgi:hypothetical protein
MMGDTHLRLSIDAMQSSTNDARGTVRALSREVEEAFGDRESTTFHPTCVLIVSRWDYVSILRYA